MSTNRRRSTPEPAAPSNGGWFKCMRSPDGLELIEANPNAFLLLYVIAFRCRWHAGFNEHGLTTGQAFLGDHLKYGMTERGYRTAKSLLEKHGFATFKATNKGTVATLANTRVFDVSARASDEQNDEQATSKRRASDEQATSKRRLTKKERRKEG